MRRAPFSAYYFCIVVAWIAGTTIAWWHPAVWMFFSMAVLIVYPLTIRTWEREEVSGD